MQLSFNCETAELDIVVVSGSFFFHQTNHSSPSPCRVVSLFRLRSNQQLPSSFSGRATTRRISTPHELLAPNSTQDSVRHRLFKISHNLFFAKTFVFEKSLFLVCSTTMLKLSSAKPSISSSFRLLSPFLSSSSSAKPSISVSFPFNSSKPSSSRFKICCIDAAQPFDHECHLHSQHLKSQSLKIAIIGFGNFGQFLAKRFSSQGHTVLAYSRTNYTDTAKQLGVTFYTSPDDICEMHPEVLILCTSILSTENLLKSFPFQRLKRSTLIVDVLSVKEFAKNIMLKYLPIEFDILCTHPMFGPESGKGSWLGLPFVFDKVRIGGKEERVTRCEKFLDIFAKEGCRMVEMSCAEHDRYAAGSQFVTHTMGRVLEKFGLESSPINTKGYETLLDLVENTTGDSFELYYGLFMYNNNAMEQLQRLDMAFEEIKQELFGKLHQVYRKQLFGEEKPRIQKLLVNGSAIPEPPPGDEIAEGKTSA